MRCNKCGFELNVDNVSIKFCPVCGEKFASDEEKPVETILEDTVEVEDDPFDNEFEEDEEEPSDNNDAKEDEMSSVVEALSRVAKKEAAKEEKSEGLAGKLLETMSESYNENLIGDYVENVWDNAETRFVSIDKSYAPKIFNGEEKLGSVEEYSKNLKEYNDRIRTEVNSIQPRINRVEENRQERLKLEKKEKIAAIKRNGNIKNLIAVLITLVCAVITAAVVLSSGNFPYFEVFAVGVVFGALFILTTASVFISLKWWFKYRRVNFVRMICRYIIFLIGIAVIVGDGLLMWFVIQLSDGNYDLVIFILMHVMGLATGMGLGLFIRTLYKFIKRAISYKRIDIEGKDAVSLTARVKKNSLKFLVVVTVFAVLFTGIGVASRVATDKVVGDFKVNGTVTGDSYTLTEISDDYLKKCGNTLVLPKEVAGKPIGKIGENLLPENNNITKIVLDKNVAPVYGALRTAQKVEELTVYFDERYSLDYYFGGNIPATLKKINLYSEGSNVNIYDNQFKGATGLTAIELPVGATVREVGVDAFTDTPLLKNAVTDGNVKYVFINNTKIAVDTVATATDIVVADDTDIVAKGVFRSLLAGANKNLNISLPYNGATESGSTGGFAKDYYFVDAITVGIKKLNIKDCNGTLSWSGITVNEFECGALSLNQTITSILGIDVSGLRSIKINSGDVPDNAFSNCNNLKTVTFGEKVTHLGSYLFYGNSKVTAYFYGSEYQYSLDGNWNGAAEVEAIFNWSDDYDIVTVDNLNYVVDTAKKTARLVSYNSIGATLNIDSVYYAGETYPVIEIADGVFKDNAVLQEVVIGASVVRIGNEAFSGCYNIDKLTLNEGVQKIGYDAFKGCSDLKYVFIPQSVTEIGYAAFSGGASKIFVEVENKPSSWNYSWIDDEDKVTYGCDFCGEDSGLLYYEQSGKAYIFGYAGNGFSGTQTVVRIPSEIGGAPVVEICELAFKDNKLMTEVIISENIEKIGQQAFDGCDNLSKVEIVESETVMSIRRRAFYNCEKLEDIFIPRRVGFIEDQAFDSTKISPYVNFTNRPSTWSSNWIDSESVVRWGVKSYGIENDFRYYITADNARSGIGSVAVIEKYLGFGGSVAVPSEIEECPVAALADYAFDGSSATEIELPSTLTSIGYSAISNCVYLKTVVIPDGVIVLGDLAFCGCSSLETLVIPASVTTVGTTPLYGCSTEKLKIYAAPSSESAAPSSWQNNIIGIGFDIFYGAVGYGSSCDYDYVFMTDNSLTVTKYWGDDTIVTVPGAIHEKEVKIIRGGTFTDNYVITEIIIQPTVISVDGYIAVNCPKLIHIRNLSSVEILADSNVEVIVNGDYQSVLSETDGVQILYKDGNAYFYGYVGNSTELNLSSYDFNAVWDYAMYGNTSVTKVSLPETTLIIGASAFENCASLTELYIPQSVTHIGTNAVKGCENLMVKYGGEPELPSGWSSDWNPDDCEIDWIYYDEIELPSMEITAGKLSDKLDGSSHYISYFGSEFVTVTGTGWEYGNLQNGGSENYLKSAIEGRHSTEATFTIHAGMPCTVSFVFNVSSEGNNYDKGYVYFNGTSQMSGSGTYTGNYVKDLNAGDEIKITYSKDGSQNSGFDCVYLNNFSISTREDSKAIARVDGDYRFVKNGSGIGLLIYCGTSDIAELPTVLNNQTVTNVGMFMAVGKSAETLTEIVIPEGVTLGEIYTENIPKLVHVRNRGALTVSAIDDVEIVNGDEEYQTVLTADNFGVQLYEKEGVKYLLGYTGTESELDLSSYDFTKVWKYAFYNNETLEKIILPEAVTEIGACAFKNCAGLTELYLPENLTFVGENAVEDCENLTVKFGGLPNDMEDWSENWNPDNRPIEYTNYVIYTQNDLIDCMDGEEHVLTDADTGIDIVTIKTDYWEYGFLKNTSDTKYLKSAVERYGSGQYPVSSFRITAKEMCKVVLEISYDTLNAVYGKNEVVFYYYDGTSIVADETHWGKSSCSYIKTLKSGDYIELSYCASARDSSRKDAVWVTELNILADKPRECYEYNLSDFPNYPGEYHISSLGTEQFVLNIDENWVTSYVEGSDDLVWQTSNHANNSVAYFTFTAKVNCTLRVNLHVNSELNGDYAKIIINGEDFITISGEDVTDFNHIVEKDDVVVFAYVKDGANSDGEDKAFITRFDVVCSEA